MNDGVGKEKRKRKPQKHIGKENLVNDEVEERSGAVISIKNNAEMQACEWPKGWTYRKSVEKSAERWPGHQQTRER